MILSNFAKSMYATGMNLSSTMAKIRETQFRMYFQVSSSTSLLFCKSKGKPHLWQVWPEIKDHQITETSNCFLNQFMVKHQLLLLKRKYYTQSRCDTEVVSSVSTAILLTNEPASLVTEPQLWSLGMWRCAVWHTDINVSEATFILKKTEYSPSKILVPWIKLHGHNLNNNHYNFKSQLK
jgi:hypothetical protein